MLNSNTLSKQWKYLLLVDDVELLYSVVEVTVKTVNADNTANTVNTVNYYTGRYN